MKGTGSKFNNKCLVRKLNSLCLNFFHLLAQKPNLEKKVIYSNKFCHNFHLSESSFTCLWLRASGLAQRLIKRFRFLFKIVHLRYAAVQGF